jgi:hypothetical protein
MVSISSYTQYYNSLIDESNWSQFCNSQPGIQRRPHEMLQYQLIPTYTQQTAGATSTIRATDNNTAGAIPLPTIQNNGYLKILGLNQMTSSMAEYNLLCDRLLDLGSISSSTTSLQTLNMSGLTRYTGGTGVYAFLAFTASTNTEVIVSVTYTNQDGITGRETKFTHGGGNFGATAFVRMIPLVSGDTGMRAIETLKFEASPVIAANTRFGYIAMFKVVGAFISDVVTQNTRLPTNFINGNFGGGIPYIAPNACLFRIRTGPGGTEFAPYDSGRYNGFFIIKEITDI